MAEAEYLIVGAGFAGAVLARELVTRLQARVTVLEERSHIAGNCHTERDTPTGIMIHVYGPHIFNTNRADAWEYVNRFAKFMPYTNRVKAVTDRGIFSMPINLHTINQFFGKTFSPAEAKAFIETLGDKSITDPQNFEEQALRFLGRELYETFFYGYTKKQWGCEPTELPASILKRLPVRFNYDDNYYNSVFQGIPEEGYTKLIERILDHDKIDTLLNTPFVRGAMSAAKHVFYSGPIDRYFDFSLGRLSYRTVTFERIDAQGDYQGNPVLNYPGLNVDYTRVHEHKHFAPWEKHEATVAFRERAKETAPKDIPYYPKRFGGDRELLRKYSELAEKERNVSFIGRLGTYRYLDMDQVIGESLDFADECIRAVQSQKSIPAFSTSPPRSK